MEGIKNMFKKILILLVAILAPFATSLALTQDAQSSKAKSADDFITTQVRFLESYKLVGDTSNPNGYFYETFVAKDLPYLKNKKLQDASSYNDIPSMEKAYKEILKVNQEGIKEWLKESKTRKRKAFKAEFAEPIGYGLKYGENQTSNRYKAVLVLDKSEKGVKVVATFPVEK